MRSRTPIAGARAVAKSRWCGGFDLEDKAEADRQLCECFEALIPGLKPEYAELIDRLDLGGETPEAAAIRLGITANNLKVRHHRARQALRRQLEQACRVCAEHHCLDCTCKTAGLARSIGV